MVITLPPPLRAKKHWGKTPESPKIPLQLGCSVTQIRHFFKRTFFNLPLIFENNVKKATVWLHERGETYRFRKASPSGSNNDDRRQWRKQGGAVGAAASRMRARAKQTLGAATRAVSPKVTERARMLTVIQGRSDSIALTKSLLIAAWAVLSCRPCPLRRSRASSPKGRALGEEGRPCGISKASPLGRAIEKEKRRRKLFAAKSASCLTRTGDTLINSQVL